MSKFKSITEKMRAYTKLRQIAEEVYKIAEASDDYWSGVEAVEQYLAEHSNELQTPAT
jgi:hypothetical protein